MAQEEVSSEWDDSPTDATGEPEASSESDASSPEQPPVEAASDGSVDSPTEPAETPAYSDAVGPDYGGYESGGYVGVDPIYQNDATPGGAEARNNKG